MSACAADVSVRFGTLKNLILWTLCGSRTNCNLPVGPSLFENVHVESPHVQPAKESDQKICRTFSGRRGMSGWGCTRGGRGIIETEKRVCLKREGVFERDGIT